MKDNELSMARASKHHGNPASRFLTTLGSFLNRNRLGEILVQKGKISPQELRFLLARQRFENRPLGEILVEARVLSRSELRFALATQSTIRTVAAAGALLIAAAGFCRPAYAGPIKDIPAGIHVVASPSFANAAAHPALFGADEKQSYDLSAFTKWVGMFDRFGQEAASNAQSQREIATWRSSLESLKGESLPVMVDKVNNLVNRVTYISDNKNWGKSDYWATPAEFFARGGDCEDFAIAKYASLRALGVPEDRLRVTILKDLEKGIPHAVLVVYTDAGPMVLDNQIKSVRAASSISHYKPIFSINRTAWWLHSMPRETTVVASVR